MIRILATAKKRPFERSEKAFCFGFPPKGIHPKVNPAFSLYIYDILINLN
jgi:hypothetical protein